jgi:replication factor C subunit 2/4
MSIKYQLNKSNSEDNDNTPWIEKYRPIAVDDILCDNYTLIKIKKIIETGDMPNIIITGIPGTGKTTTILSIVMNLYGENYEDYILELNASDERGIKVAQEEITHFCKKKINQDRYNHKIILLDEADHLTKKAQQIINNLMEEYHNNTRFAFTCNNSLKIIESIQSKSIILRYTRIRMEDVIKRLLTICIAENVKYNTNGIEKLALIANGDMRKAINGLQTIHNGFGKVIEKNVYKIFDYPKISTIENIINLCINKDFTAASSVIFDLKNSGNSSNDIILSLINVIKISNTDEEIKINFIKELCDTCIIISKGISSNLQLISCIGRMCSL